MNRVKIPAQAWLWIVKLFELEMPATKISEETGISYPTVLKAVNVIRESILASTDHGKEVLLRGKSIREGIISSVIEERDGIVCLEPLLDDHVKVSIKLGQGCIIFLDKVVSAQSLVCRNLKHSIVDHGRTFPHYRVYLFGQEGFWPFVKERLVKYHGIQDEKFPVYLLEMEFRYVNRHLQLFDILVEYLCRFIPLALRKRKEHFVKA